MSKKQRQAHVYEHHKGDTFASPVDKRKCRASVSDREGWHSHQCARQATLDNADHEWVSVPEGTCTKSTGGSIAAVKPAT